MKLFPTERTGPLPAIVAQDILWLAFLLPAAGLYRGVLALGKGYYAVRAKGPWWSAAYTAAAMTFVVLIVRRLRVRRS